MNVFKRILVIMLALAMTACSAAPAAPASSAAPAAPVSSAAPAVSEAPAASEDTSVPTFNEIQPYMQSKSESKERALLMALKPFLSSRRCETIDTFVRLLDIASLIGRIR